MGLLLVRIEFGRKIASLVRMFSILERPYFNVFFNVIEICSFHVYSCYSLLRDNVLIITIALIELFQTNAKKTWFILV